MTNEQSSSISGAEKRLRIGVPVYDTIRPYTQEVVEGLSVLGGMRRQGEITLTQKTEDVRRLMSQGEAKVQSYLRELKEALADCVTLDEQSGADAAEQLRRQVTELYSKLENQITQLIELINALSGQITRLNYQRADLGEDKKRTMVDQIKLAHLYVIDIKRQLVQMKEALFPLRQTYGFSINQ